LVWQTKRLERALGDNQGDIKEDELALSLGLSGLSGVESRIVV